MCGAVRLHKIGPSVKAVVSFVELDCSCALRGFLCSRCAQQVINETAAIKIMNSGLDFHNKTLPWQLIDPKQ